MPIPDEWAYKGIAGTKSTKVFYCSWHCLRAAEKKRKQGSKAGQRDEIMQMLRRGFSENQVAETVGVTIGTVQYWKDRMPDVGWEE